MSGEPRDYVTDIPPIPATVDIRHPTGSRTEFILVRHGRTDGNVRRVLVGRTDIPLDALGEKQAVAVGNYLEHRHKPDYVISSPLIRAHNTARAIAARYELPIHFDPDLMELNFGSFEGLSIEQIAEAAPEFASNFGDLDIDRQWPKGERLSEFHDRVLSTFLRLAASHENETVVVVSHGGVLGSFAAQLVGTHPNDWVRFQIQNCSVTHVELGPENSVIHCLNETAHLTDINEAHQ